MSFSQLWQEDKNFQNLIYRLWPTELDSNHDNQNFLVGLLTFRNFADLIISNVDMNDREQSRLILGKFEDYFEAILNEDFPKKETQYELRESILLFNEFKERLYKSSFIENVSSEDRDHLSIVLANSEKIKKLAEGFPNPHGGKVHLVISPDEIQSIHISNKDGICAGLDYLALATLAHIEFRPAEKKDDFKTIENKLRKAFQTGKSKTPPETIVINGYGTRDDFMDEIRYFNFDRQNSSYGPYGVVAREIQTDLGYSIRFIFNTTTIAGRDGDFAGIYYTKTALERHSLRLKNILDQGLPVTIAFRKPDSPAFIFHQVSIVGYHLPPAGNIPDYFYTLDSNAPATYSELSFHPNSDRFNLGIITYRSYANIYSDPVTQIVYKTAEGMKDFGFSGKFKMMSYSFSEEKIPIASNIPPCLDLNEPQNLKNLNIEPIFTSAAH